MDGNACGSWRSKDTYTLFPLFSPSLFSSLFSEPIGGPSGLDLRDDVRQIMFILSICQSANRSVGPAGLTIAFPFFATRMRICLSPPPLPGLGPCRRSFYGLCPLPSLPIGTDRALPGCAIAHLTAEAEKQACRERIASLQYPPVAI